MTAYWDQWTRAELLSMQGIEIDDYHDDDHYDDNNKDEEQECPCPSQCMNCLGMSWRDFM